MPKRDNPEFRLQCQIAEYLGIAAKPGLYWFHVPNEGNQLLRGIRMKKAGVKAGVPDLVMLYRSKFIGIELKAGKGRQSESQKAAETAIITAGGVYRVCRGFDEAVDFLKLLEVVR